jgi:hypothetical protein
VREKFHSFRIIVLVVLIGVSNATSSAIAAEKKKKSAQNTASIKKAKWVQEPTTFMGFELGQQLSKSVSVECPKFNKFNMIDIAEAEKLDKLCQLYDTDAYSVFGFKVPPLDKLATIKTLDGSLDGVVGNFRIDFNSSDFSQVMEMLNIKYGSPHKKEVEKVKTNGGAEFDNIVLSWSGENVFIKVESLVSRSFNGGLLRERGSINVFTSEYLAKISSLSKESAQKGAAGL